MDDDELERFHNGDTLDDIPVIRVPQVPPPGLRPLSPEQLKRSARLSWGKIGALTLTGAGIGALAVAGGISLADNGNQHSPVPQVAKSSLSPTPSDTEAEPSPEKPDKETGAESVSPSSGPVSVNVISSPATGGDISSSYCIKWTGSAAGTERDAVLLLEAPGYQCSAFVVDRATGKVRGPQGVLSEFPVTCLAPKTYAATLKNAWDMTYYVCLADHHGA